jgi:hypothetical protein
MISVARGQEPELATAKYIAATLSIYIFKYTFSSELVEEVTMAGPYMIRRRIALPQIAITYSMPHSE